MRPTSAVLLLLAVAYGAAPLGYTMRCLYRFSRPLFDAHVTLGRTPLTMPMKLRLASPVAVVGISI